MDLTLFKSAVTLFVISSILLPVFKWLKRYVKLLLHYRDMPHLPLLPVLGNTHHVIGKRLYEFFHDMSNKFKNEPYYMFWNGTLPCVCFHKADHVSTIMSSSKMIEKSPGYKVLSGLLGDGILLSKGHKWLSRRKLLTPTFHFEILNGFQQIMNEQSEILVDILLEKCKTEKVIDVEPLITNCTVDILCETAMGHNVNAQRDPNSPYLKSVQRVAYLMEKRAFKVHLRNNFIFNLLHGKEYNKHLKISQDFTTNVILKRNEEFENGEINTHGRQALLDLLLKSRKEDPSLTFQDIREEVDNFLFAGHDTTSATLCWTLQLLGSHPEVQKKVHEELDEILQGSNRYFTNEDLSKMKYLHCVIKETMRIMTPVIHVGRTVTEDTKLGDKTILKGSAVLILLSDIHRDERHFPEPEAFKPERFFKIKETVDNVDNAYIYMPFSAGPRNCIGQRFAQNELKIVLGSILRRFHLEATQTLAETKPIFNIVLRPEHGLHIKFTERS